MHATGRLDDPGGDLDQPEPQRLRPKKDYPGASGYAPGRTTGSASGSARVRRHSTGLKAGAHTTGSATGASVGGSARTGY